MERSVLHKELKGRGYIRSHAITGNTDLWVGEGDKVYVLEVLPGECLALREDPRFNLKRREAAAKRDAERIGKPEAVKRILALAHHADPDMYVGDLLQNLRRKITAMEPDDIRGLYNFWVRERNPQGAETLNYEPVSEVTL